MRNYLGTGTYVIGLVTALYVGTLVNGVLLHASAAPRATPSVSWQIVRNSTPQDSVPMMRTVSVSCPTGTTLSGGGAVVGHEVGASRPVADQFGILIESQPINGANGWRASGIVPRKGDTWGVAVYAICAKP